MNQAPADRIFLATFRDELNSYVSARPIEKAGYFAFFSKTATVFGLLLFVVLSGGGLVYASQSSLPGQLLYPVKIKTEKTRLATAIKPEKKKKLQLEFVDTRVKEVKIISEKKNPDKNAAKALVIIDEKIKEIENEKLLTDKELEDNDSATSTVSVSSTTINAKNQINYQKKMQRDFIKKTKENDWRDYQKSKEKLEESRQILKKMLKKQEQRDRRGDEKSNIDNTRSQTDSTKQDEDGDEGDNKSDRQKNDSQNSLQQDRN